DVANVAPTGVVSNDGPVPEGSAATISFAQQLDPSTADTAAGFTYAYDCGHGYGAPTPNATGACSFDDQGTYPVKATISDKDGGSTESPSSVVVTNVAPTATLAAPAPVNEGSAATISVTGQTDPSHADTAAGFLYAFACDGATFPAATSSPSTTCSYDDGPS